MVAAFSAGEDPKARRCPYLTRQIDDSVAGTSGVPGLWLAKPRGAGGSYVPRDWHAASAPVRIRGDGQAIREHTGTSCGAPHAWANDHWDASRVPSCQSPPADLALPHGERPFGSSAYAAPSAVRIPTEQ
ncbi:hypothetical protein VTK73DRAFT_4742 [Phialemonium thermophilum]|uniref:Uncharacterized protein n=1 Tax=Phialemonium thermophilum TaxID=223376 RepID=A0ABR3V694_9PEZI